MPGTHSRWDDLAVWLMVAAAIAVTASSGTRPVDATRPPNAKEYVVAAHDFDGMPHNHNQVLL